MKAHIKSLGVLSLALLLASGVAFGHGNTKPLHGGVMQMVGERLGITDQFQGVDELRPQPDGSFEIVERLEGGRRQISRCQSPPMLLGWATGNLPEPPNQPQLGMQNMRLIMPALQKARPTAASSPVYKGVAVPSQQRDTRIVKDLSPAEIAREIVEGLRDLLAESGLKDLKEAVGIMARAKGFPQGPKPVLV